MIGGFNMLSKEGWVCPICGRGLSPWTSECPCYVNKNNSNTTTTTSTTMYSGYIDIPYGSGEQNEKS